MIPLAIGLFQLHLEFVNIILVYHLFGYPYAHTPYALGPSGGLRLQGLNPFGMFWAEFVEAESCAAPQAALQNRLKAYHLIKASELLHRVRIIFNTAQLVFL